jgi:hypothetical protein
MRLDPAETDFEVEAQLRHLQQVHDDLRAVARALERRRQDAGAYQGPRRRRDDAIAAARC